MPHLFDPLTLRGVTIRNRIGVSPMCQYSSVDGHATDWHLVHLGSRAVGGAGLVFAEATAVLPEGRISPEDAGLWTDSQIAPLKRITSFVRSHGAVAGIQLAHAGRKGSAARPWEGGAHIDESTRGWTTVAPSAIAFGGNLPKVPKELSLEDIASIRRAFGAAAKRAVEAEFQMVELHAAHGYLAHEFYSPLSNRRNDAYGGSFENRTRFVLETVREIRGVIPDSMPLSVRLSCTDWIEGGWTIDDTVSLAKRLKTEGVDLVDCSSGFNSSDYKSIPFGAGFQTPFSERVRREAMIATAAVGVITQPMQADEAIRNGRADIVLLGREMLRDAYWPVHAAQALRKTEGVSLPTQYQYAVNPKG